MKNLRYLFAIFFQLIDAFLTPFKWVILKFSRQHLRPSRSVLPGALIHNRRFTVIRELLAFANLGRAGLACAVAVITMVMLFAQPARAQTGTYVNPRTVVLWSGIVTNGQTLSNLFVGTNFLNYSGFHRIGLWTTELPVSIAANASLLAPNGASTGTNGTFTLALDFSPGSGNGYTNNILGTNLVFSTSTNSAFTWTQGFPGAGGTNGGQAAVTFTNLDWVWGDSVAYFKGTKVSTTTTNNAGFYLQIDAVVTP